MVCKTILSPHVLKDGTSQIKIYVNEGGKNKHYIGTKLRVDPKFWDAKKGVVKSSHPMALAYNAKLKKQLIDIETHLLQGGAIKTFGVGKVESVVELIYKIIDEAQKGVTPLRKSTAKTYKTLGNRLEQYCTSKGIGGNLSFDDIDMDFYRQFSDWLETDAGCGIAGIGKHFKVLKRIMNAGIERGLHSNQVHTNKAFKAHKLGTNKIYLTAEEISLIERLDLSTHPMLERERDRFLVSYYLILRYSDATMLVKDNVFEKNAMQYIRIISTKTHRECIVPLKPAAFAILEKYKWKMDFSSNQQANRGLKEIAAMAGITNPVTQDGIKLPKNKFVSTHTARRSAATNLYLNGASIKLIADLGGWEKQETLRVYLRASGLETAMLAGSMAFFQ